MPLVVPVLRFFVVFLNVYETFKTLKPPPPSARRAGKPSARALTQRKRDIKGCLAVWVVWCCYAAYERTFDRAVGLFLPFYSEIKSVFLLFLLLTRAKGAEPLFLHVLRPLIKPYSAVVDPTLDLSRDLGDFIFALLQVPLDYVVSSSWFPSWRTEESEDESSRSLSSAPASIADSNSSTRANTQSNIPILVNHVGAVQSSRVQSAGQGSGFLRSVSDNQYSNDRPLARNPVDPRAPRSRRSVSASITSLPAYSEHPSNDPPQYSRTISRYNEHQIWYPTVSAPRTSGQEPSLSALDQFVSAPEYQSPEWRSYPAFPSAYPPTPLPASASLPASSRSNADHRLVSGPAYPPIPENEQGFDEVLEKQHEEHPGSAHCSSINNKIPSGASHSLENVDGTRQPDEDILLDDSICSSEAGLSEDDFGISLRTPYRSPEAIPSSAYSSVDSLTSPLATTHTPLSLRVKTSSDSISSGSSSLTGRKRPHTAFQGKTRSTHTASQSRNSTLRERLTPFSVAEEPLQSSSSEDEHESEGDSGTKAKRQRVLDPLKRRSTLRLAARGVGSAHKAPLPSRSATARGRGTTSQAISHTKAGSIATNNSTIKARKSTLSTRRAGPQGVVKTASASSGQSGTLRGRA